jgi:uncharacterized protein YbaR (Trm112 family)
LNIVLQKKIKREGNVLPQDLVNILICPACGAAVREKENAIECTDCKNRYPIEDGIPVMLVDRATRAAAEKH